MSHALESLNPLAILAVAAVGFLLGGLWYSPLLFAKTWMAEAKITPDMWKSKPGRGPALMVLTAVMTLISTTTLAMFLAETFTDGVFKGAEYGFALGVGLVATRYATNNFFELKSIRHFAIVAGYDVALFTVQGAILGVWR
jgi:hypothetical protein